MTPAVTKAQAALDAARAVEAERAAEHTAARDAAEIGRTRDELEAARRIRVDAEKALADAQAAAEAAELERKRARLAAAVVAADRRRLFARLEKTIGRLAELRRWELRPSRFANAGITMDLALVEERPDLLQPPREHKRALAAFVAAELERGKALRAVAKAIALQNGAVDEAKALAAELGATIPPLAHVPERHVHALAALERHRDEATREWIVGWAICFGVEIVGTNAIGHDFLEAEHRGIDRWTFARETVLCGDPRDVLHALAPKPQPEGAGQALYPLEECEEARRRLYGSQP